jgi:CBS domain-containing protein
MNVGTIMQRTVLTVRPETSLRDVARLLVEHGDGRLVGIVSRADHVRTFVRSDEELRDAIVVIATDWRVDDAEIQAPEVDLLGMPTTPR